jgi:hypothetical protein
LTGVTLGDLIFSQVPGPSQQFPSPAVGGQAFTVNRRGEGGCPRVVGGHGTFEPCPKGFFAACGGDGPQDSTVWHDPCDGEAQ